jgi:hypothetical protein
MKTTQSVVNRIASAPTTATHGTAATDGVRSAIDGPTLQRLGFLYLVLQMIGWKCWCSNTSWMFRDKQGYYVRCLDCGRRVPHEPLLGDRVV